jgi:hypothetical protein
VWMMGVLFCVCACGGRGGLHCLRQLAGWPGALLPSACLLACFTLRATPHAAAEPRLRSGARPPSCPSRARCLQAARAYDAACREIKGAEAVCNFPQGEAEKLNVAQASLKGSK